MDITKFTEKYNKIDGKIYTVEEEINLTDGKFEGQLEHDNINTKTLNIYTGPKLTGDQISTYTISTPSLTPWKIILSVFSDVTPLYVSYETSGDQVEADDINNLQDGVNDTQEELNNEVERATNRENTIESNLNKEITRATNKENEIANNLTVEVTRAQEAEQLLTDNLDKEINRATSAEQTLTNTINTNKPIWDDKYTKNEIDNKISQVITDLDWKESVATYDDLATTYPNPDDGWTVNVKDTDITYRWSGSAWVAISANSIPLATSTTDGKMSKEDKVNLDDVNAKKHTHDNKSILDTITQTLINNWNSAFTHISDAVKHITSAERTLWNTVSNKLNLSGGTLTGKLTITGTAESKPLNVRGINGISTDGTTDDALYLNYGTTNPVYVNGSNAVYHGGNKPTKSDVGLANVDNTSDLNKPISTATQTALDGKANSSHTHTKSQITDMPTSLKNPNALTINLNGTSQGDYDGSSAKSINITPSSIGASATSHTHDDRYYTETECNTKFATKDELSASGNGDMLKSVYDTDGDGVVDKATKLATARTIALTGTVIGSGSFDGSGNLSISTTKTPYEAKYDFNNVTYMKLFTITINATYPNFPITFNLTGRSTVSKPTNFTIKFTNPNDTSPSISKFTYTGDTVYGSTAMLYKTTSTGNTYEFWVKQGESYDTITLYNLNYRSDRMSITFNGTTADSLPTNMALSVACTLETVKMNIDGSATKATQDSDGNQINTTYVKKGMTWNELMGV